MRRIAHKRHTLAAVSDKIRNLSQIAMLGHAACAQHEHALLLQPRQRIAQGIAGLGHEEVAACMVADSRKIGRACGRAHHDVAHDPLDCGRHESSERAHDRFRRRRRIGRD